MQMPPIYQSNPNLEIVDGVFRTKIDGLLYLQHKKFQDERGFFADITGLKNLEKAIGKRPELKQINSHQCGAWFARRRLA